MDALLAFEFLTEKLRTAFPTAVPAQLTYQVSTQPDVLFQEPVL